jgi:hypothetical protein
MIDNILNNLPILEDFKNLNRGDGIYSRQYGIGTIESLYEEDEIIAQFSSLRKRLSIYDDISKIPEKYHQKQGRAKVEVVCDGKSMSFAEFKRMNRAEKKRIKLKEKLLRG